MFIANEVLVMDQNDKLFYVKLYIDLWREQLEELITIKRFRILRIRFAKVAPA